MSDPLQRVLKTHASRTAKITDLGYSYNPRGEVTDTYESTPHSGGYYHIAESYWPDGSTHSVTTNFAGMPTWNYTPDGEGRLTSIAASSGQNPLISTTYGLFGPTNLTYGSSDTDTYGYDPQTGRQNSYAFNINGQSETGSLTWNANGTLRTLQISDPFQAPNAQTCTNTYDDLTRLTNNSCSGTGALSNTFAYDLFGNMTKSGGSNFLPTYNLHNQYQTLPAGTPTYSASGNATYDGSHRYVWDSDNKNVQLDSGALIMTYDALGRWVESNNTAQSQISQAVYAPDGREAAVMSSQSVISVYVDLPKGAKAIYLSGGISNYWHPDWLGTARLVTSTTRAKVFDEDFGPFGEVRHGPIADNFFTGVAQVPEANDLRTFPARNLGTGQSRWLSPDPAGIAAVDLTNPQSFNRYAYVLGNPLRLVDPTGTTDQEPLDGATFADDCFAASRKEPCGNSSGWSGGWSFPIPIFGGDGSGTSRPIPGAPSAGTSTSAHLPPSIYPGRGFPTSPDFGGNAFVPGAAPVVYDTGAIFVDVATGLGEVLGGTICVGTGVCEAAAVAVGAAAAGAGAYVFYRQWHKSKTPSVFQSKERVTDAVRKECEELRSCQSRQKWQSEIRPRVG